jgi:hypothetical protein
MTAKIDVKDKKRRRNVRDERLEEVDSRLHNNLLLKWKNQLKQPT